MRTVNADVLMSGAKGSGTYTAPVSYGPGVADIMLLIHVSAVSGTSPTLVVSMEQSADGTSWSAVGGSSTATLNAVGNAACNANISQPYARVTATVAGTTPSLTFRVAALVFAD